MGVLALPYGNANLCNSVLSGGPFSGCDPAESEKAVNFDNQLHRIL